MSDPVNEIVDFFEALTPDSVARCPEIYAPQALFKDPFNEVRGVPAIEAIFQHMFRTLEAPHFVVQQRVESSHQCFLTWDFHFRFKNFAQDTEQTIHGCSHLLLAPDGRITVHRDYWDAAEELYEKLPVLGGLMRWVKKRVNT